MFKTSLDDSWSAGLGVCERLPLADAATEHGTQDVSREEFVQAFLASLVNDYDLDATHEPEDFIDEATELLALLDEYPVQLRLEVA